MTLGLPDLDDVLETLQLLPEVEPLLYVEGVTDQVRGARLPQLLQEPLGVGQTVYLEDGAAQLPHSQANLLRNSDLSPQKLMLYFILQLSQLTSQYST